MEAISVLLLSQLKITNLSTLDRTGKQSAWRVRNTSKAGSNIIIEYFNFFPLFSSKHLDFLIWKEVFELILNKQHLIKNGIEGLNKIENLKNQMNNKRVNFNWEQLKNFYNKS